MTGGAHAPRVWFPAPLLETLAHENGFDEGVEPDSRGRLCSQSEIEVGRAASVLARSVLECGDPVLPGRFESADMSKHSSIFGSRGRSPHQRFTSIREIRGLIFSCQACVSWLINLLSHNVSAGSIRSANRGEFPRETAKAVASRRRRNW